MSDSRLGWGRKYVLIRQNPSQTSPQKIGASVPDGWAGYLRNGHLFLKTFRHTAGATYPDCGSSFEVYTDQEILELETLGPVVRLEPGGMVEHTEHWHLWRDVPTVRGDDDVDRFILPKVRPLL